MRQQHLELATFVFAPIVSASEEGVLQDSGGHKERGNRRLSARRFMFETLVQCEESATPTIAPLKLVRLPTKIESQT